MANLGTVSSNLVERLFVDFADQISATGSLVGTHESTERLLDKVLGTERVAIIMEEIRGPAGRTMWDKLGNVNEAVLANYLKNEYPQTVAVVLSKIKSDHAGRVLTQLPESFAMEVVMRMLRMEAVQKEVLDDVERRCAPSSVTNLARTNRRDAHELMAEIFNSLDRNTETRFITALEERNRDTAERIKSLMFTFEDLAEARQRRDPDAPAQRREGKAADRPQGRLRRAQGSVLLEHVRARRQAAQGRDGGHGPGPPQGRRGSAGPPRVGRQRPRGARRDHHLRRQRRRRAGVLSAAMAMPQKFTFDVSFDHLGDAERALAGRAPLHAATNSKRRAKRPSPKAMPQALPKRQHRRNRSPPTPWRRSPKASLPCSRLRTPPRSIRSAARVAAMRTIVAKLVPGLAAKDPLAEVEAFATKCLHEAIDEPRVVLRVAHEIYEPLRERLDALANAAGYAGRIVLLVDDAIAAGDARVEWADGGAERNLAGQCAEIDAIAGTHAAIPRRPPVPFPRKE